MLCIDWKYVCNNLGIKSKTRPAHTKKKPIFVAYVNFQPIKYNIELV